MVQFSTACCLGRCLQGTISHPSCADDGFRSEERTTSSLGICSKQVILYTFLNYYCLNKSVISFITDSSIHKQGKYTPLTRIPVVDDSIFSTFPKVFALILSWNISNDLKEVLKKVNPNIKFINIHNENN